MFAEIVKHTMKKLKLFLILIICCLTLQAQTRNKQYEAYIKKYRELAVEEMKRYHIPASITLAQGLLESGAGQSELARKSNNHFGIKCHNWAGHKIFHDDDKKGECFRKYKDVELSYRDHSDFLRYRDRYKFLFDLDITDCHDFHIVHLQICRSVRTSENSAAADNTHTKFLHT